jgi:hypothetical protein
MNEPTHLKIDFPNICKEKVANMGTGFINICILKSEWYFTRIDSWEVSNWFVDVLWLFYTWFVWSLFSMKEPFIRNIRISCLEKVECVVLLFTNGNNLCMLLCVIFENSCLLECACHVFWVYVLSSGRSRNY